MITGQVRTLNIESPVLEAYGANREVRRLSGGDVSQTDGSRRETAHRRGGKREKRQSRKGPKKKWDWVDRMRGALVINDAGHIKNKKTERS